jgi:hypothetical protein
LCRPAERVDANRTRVRGNIGIGVVVVEQHAPFGAGGTVSSNPVPSSGESANFRSLGGGRWF